jgi:chromosomal replication initiator protein
VSSISVGESQVELSNTLWEHALSTLEGRIKPHNFEMWLRPISCKEIAGDRIVLCAPSRWIKDWFQDNYQAIVLDALRAQTRRQFEIVFEVREAEPARQPTAPVDTDAAPPPPEPPAVTVRVERSDRSEPLGDLLPNYTFESFVIGPSNELAHAASLQVASVPASRYNPLFIYGGVGLGKTHLVHAIGHRLREMRPGCRVIYIKTEAFLNEFITCIRNGKIDEFRAKYRERCDALLIDDVQFLAGKDRTQEEFFHTFNQLFESHKQIVLTADKYPHEIPDLEDRLRSRFQNGLIADIQPPELETRIAILRKKAALEEIPLPDEVATYLAANIKSNVRELEGLLRRVHAFAELQNQQITTEFARETLKNFLSQAAHSLTVEAVQKEVASYFGVKLADLKSPRRHQTIARPRQIAMYLARKLCKSSYPELGQKFGGKDHTTVLSACRKIEQLIGSDPKVRHSVEELERHLAS